MLKMKIINPFSYTYLKSDNHKSQKNEQIKRGDYVSALIVMGHKSYHISTYIATLSKIEKRKKSYFFARKSAEKRIKLFLSGEWRRIV